MSDLLTPNPPTELMRLLRARKIENAFEITRNNAEKYKHILSEEDYEIFAKAFFSKKNNLDKVNCECMHR